MRYESDFPGILPGRRTGTFSRRAIVDDSRVCTVAVGTEICPCSSQARKRAGRAEGTCDEQVCGPELARWTWSGRAPHRLRAFVRVAARSGVCQAQGCVNSGSLPALDADQPRPQ